MSRYVLVKRDQCETEATSCAGIVRTQKEHCGRLSMTQCALTRKPVARRPKAVPPDHCSQPFDINARSPSWIAISPIARDGIVYHAVFMTRTKHMRIRKAKCLPMMRASPRHGRASASKSASSMLHDGVLVSSYLCPTQLPLTFDRLPYSLTRSAVAGPVMLVHGVTSSYSSKEDC